MTRIYLSGPISEGEHPHEWRDAISSEWSDPEWINPFKLHNIPDDELSDRVQEIINQNMTEIAESDAVLLRRIENYNLCGASMEAREAFTVDVPVIVWNAGESEVPLFLKGHATKVYSDRESSVEAVVKIASE